MSDLLPAPPRAYIDRLEFEQPRRLRLVGRWLPEDLDKLYWAVDALRWWEPALVDLRSLPGLPAPLLAALAETGRRCVRLHWLVGETVPAKALDPWGYRTHRELGPARIAALQGLDLIRGELEHLSQFDSMWREPPGLPSVYVPPLSEVDWCLRVYYQPAFLPGGCVTVFGAGERAQIRLGYCWDEGTGADLDPAELLSLLEQIAGAREIDSSDAVLDGLEAGIWCQGRAVRGWAASCNAGELYARDRRWIAIRGVYDLVRAHLSGFEVEIFTQGVGSHLSCEEV